MVFFFFSFSADPLPLSHRCTGTPLACKREWGSPLSQICACRALSHLVLIWFVSVFFFFSFAADPSLSLTGALLGPHSLASVSGGSPFSRIRTRRALPLMDVRCEARRCRSQLVCFLLLLFFRSLTAPFVTWEPPPARPFVTRRPRRVALPCRIVLPCHVSLALTYVTSPHRVALSTPGHLRVGLSASLEAHPQHDTRFGPVVEMCERVGGRREVWAEHIVVYLD
jgi:hypothetical protein